jgi:hypothetical protein
VILSCDAQELRAGSCPAIGQSARQTETSIPANTIERRTVRWFMWTILRVIVGIRSKARTPIRTQPDQLLNID